MSLVVLALYGIGRLLDAVFGKKEEAVLCLPSK
jgi:hypothetical protein